MNGADTFALILGLVLLFIVVFAALGHYARKQNGDSGSTGASADKAQPLPPM
jgi:hypothetical protein